MSLRAEGVAISRPQPLILSLSKNLPLPPLILSLSKNLVERHHLAGAHFRERLTRVALVTGLLGSISPNNPNQKPNITISYHTISETNICRTSLINIVSSTREDSDPKNQKIADKIETIPKKTEIAIRPITAFFRFRSNPLPVTCPTSTGVKAINAVLPTTTAIMKSLVCSILFHLLFLLGKCLVARLAFYRFLQVFFPSAKYTPYPIPIATRLNRELRPQILHDIAKISIIPTAHRKAPPVTAPLPSLILSSASLKHNVKPWNRRARLIPNTVIAGANFCNSMTILSKLTIITSFVVNHITSLKDAKGEFKRSCTPLCALSTLSLDGRGSG